MASLRLSLLSRIVLALLAVGLIPVVVLAVQLVGLNREALTTQVLRSHAVAARSTAERVDAYLEATLAPVEAILARAEVVADPGGDQARALIGGILEAQPRLIALEVTDPTGARAYLARRRERTAVADRLLGGAGPGTVEIVAADGATWARFDLALEGGRGWVRVVANALELAAMAAPEEFGEGALLAVFDRSGRWLVGAERARFSPDLVAAAVAGRLSGAGRFQAAPGGADGGADGRAGDVLGAFAPARRLAWTVVSQQPAAVAEAIARTARGQAMIASAGAGLLVLLFAGIAYATVVRPVRGLLAAQQDLIADDPDSGNELARLRNSFQQLAERVRERTTLDRLPLGRYRVTEVLGEGAMGTVFRAWDPKLERDVALKTIKLSGDLGLIERDELVAGLLKEARLVAQFSHPNIVAVYDVEDSTAAPFVAMEFIDGVTLRQYLGKSGRLDLAPALYIGIGIARALAAAHARDIVHHDVKPANVMIGRDDTVKVTDFGIAEALSSFATERAQLYGTPGYLAPEALRGEGYGKPADAFALGVILYECVSGRRPFAGGTVPQIVQATVRGEIQPLPRSGVPPELGLLILQLMAADAGARPQDLGVVAGRLTAMAGVAGPTAPVVRGGRMREIEDEWSASRLSSAVDLFGIDVTRPGG